MSSDSRDRTQEPTQPQPQAPAEAAPRSRTFGALEVRPEPEGLRVAVVEYHAWPVVIPWEVLAELRAEVAPSELRAEASPAEP